ncbi:MAG: creatininase family protein [Clostridia bacterium]|nr:creatininase family protein [Clostridia bacterium]
MNACDMTADQVVDRNWRTAYLPVAAFVQHGPHLPVTSGMLVTHALGEEISSRIDAFMLPVQPFATCLEQQDPYSVGVDPGLLYDMILNIARELKRQGFTRLVIHKGYHGLTVLYPLTRHLNAAEGIHTVLVDPCALVADQGLLQGTGNFHACELQTSLMMHLFSECVRRDKIYGIDCVPQAPPQRLSYKPMAAYCSDGVWGRPSLASAEKGEKFFRAAVDLSTAYIQDVFSFIDSNGDYTGGRA